MKAKAGEIYTVYNNYLKRYTACQVAYIAPPDQVSKQFWAVILSLDWAGDAPLTAEELPQLRPLYKDFMYCTRRMGFIETEERDEIYIALCGILDALPDGMLQKDALLEKFEELRDF